LLGFAISLFSQGNVGIGTTTPTQKLQVNGKVKVGDDATAPSAGTIRWNATKSDFEGYNGTEWLSLTTSNRSSTIGSPNDIGQLVDYNSGPPPIAQASASFGSAVDISGDWAVVGAPSEGQGGAAHVFKRVGTAWNYFMKLTSPDIGNKDRFGDAVAIDGNYIIVGAPYDSLNTVEYNGSAYIFFYNGSTWAQEFKIFNPISSGVRDFFGNSVDISGDMVIIGANQQDDGANADEGRAWGFKRNGASWSQMGLFTAPSGMAGAYFGFSVSIYGNYIAVSAPFFDLPTGLGAIFVFFYNGTSWTFQQRLTASDPGNDLFGCSISLYNNTIAVGARVATEEYANQGASYVFFRSGTVWTQQAKLIIPKTNSFGNAVSLSGDFLLVGAPDTRGYNECGTVAISVLGKAFVYKRTGTAWERFLAVDMPGVNDGDFFGNAVAIDDNYICVGARGADINGVSGSGKVIFGKLE
jgi:FG-GAP repeat